MEESCLSRPPIMRDLSVTNLENLIQSAGCQLTATEA